MRNQPALRLTGYADPWSQSHLWFVILKPIKLDLSNAGIIEFETSILEGAYRLETADLSNNLFFGLPRDFFKWNAMLTRIDLSNNQMRSLRPDAFMGLKKLQFLDLSGNQLSGIALWYDFSKHEHE